MISHRLGHSSLAITSDLYTHVIPAVAQDAANRIAKLIDPEPPASDAANERQYSASTAQSRLKDDGQAS